MIYRFISFSSGGYSILLRGNFSPFMHSNDVKFDVLNVKRVMRI
jgi:hypothetical protein